MLYQKMVDPEKLVELRDQAPGELLHAVFESYETPLTGAQIKRILAGVVAEKKWNSWWTAARKHPQVIASTRVKRAYEWAESAADAHGAVWQSFEAANPRGRIEQLRRDGARDQDLKSRMSKALAEQAAAHATKDPGLACEIWFALEKSGEPAPATVAWSPQSLVRSVKDPRDMLNGIQARPLRERTYAMVRDAREDWQDLYVQLLSQEKDARALDRLTGALEETVPQQLESFLDQLLSQPKKNPAAFVWFVERAADRPPWLARNPIRMVKQMLWVLNDDTFASFKAARLLPLVESGGTLPRLLSHLDQAQAEEVSNALEKSGSLEEYQRQPLLNAIQLRFPELRKEEEAPLYATIASIDAKRAEMKELAEVEIPANRQAIEEAREMGDLRENFEYKSARQRHEYLAARASALNHDLTRVRPIDASQVQGDEVVIGSKIKLSSKEGEARVLTILGPWESEPEQDILSNESDMAKSLLGLSPGDDIDLVGVSYRIDSIEPWE
ncbi:MAG: GreA/GreB family elongation factor [Acidobacteriota bacterium]